MPVDYRMEGHVDDLKQHIKHMVSNKTDNNITNKTRALGVVKEISTCFDETTSTRIRSRKHVVPSSSEDAEMMVRDMHSVRLFELCPGRTHRQGFSVTILYQYLHIFTSGVIIPVFIKIYQWYYFIPIIIPVYQWYHFIPISIPVYQWHHFIPIIIPVYQW